MGIDVPILATGTIEPTIGPDGGPRLVVRASTRFRLSESLGLEPPAGPWPAADTLILILDGELSPKPQQ